jgi:hypothetical protein
MCGQRCKSSATPDAVSELLSGARRGAVCWDDHVARGTAVLRERPAPRSPRQAEGLALFPGYTIEQADEAL